MIRIFRIFLLGMSTFLLFGCSAIGTKTVAPNKKAFEDEDRYILFALRAEQLREYNASATIFNTLYKKSDKKEYLYRSLQDDLVAGANQTIIKRVDAITKGSIDDSKLIRLKILALMNLEQYEKAKDLALTLVAKTDDAEDYVLVGNIYVKEKKFDIALKYLESGYTKNYDEKILDKMAIILYVNLDRKKDAIAQLETYSRMNGCSELICNRLIGFYSNENNIDGLLSIYLRYYKMTKRNDLAKKIVQIYGYQKEYHKLIEFLEKNKIDDMLLLELYASLKEYKKGAALAEKLYDETGEIKYLGQSAIYEYEASPKKQQDSVMQKNVVHKLKEVLKEDRSALYLNYLGYLMIDHEIDIKQGIRYVKEAIKQEPESAYYLDSLAWGYYKLGWCKKAKKLMDKIVKMEGGDDKEVLSHIEKINKCIKGNK